MKTFTKLVSKVVSIQVKNDTICNESCPFFRMVNSSEEADWCDLYSTHLNNSNDADANRCDQCINDFNDENHELIKLK